MSASTLSPDISVNEAIRLVPETVAVFNRYGIDACCGGAASIRDAALRDGAPLDELMDDLASVSSPAS
jgi:regulator of cell morphogenesis and NO signaling